MIMHFEVYKELDDEAPAEPNTERSQVWRWRLKAANGENIANGSEAYKTKRNVLRAVKQVNDLFANPLPVVQYLA